MNVRRQARMRTPSPSDRPAASARIGLPRTLGFLVRLYPAWALPVVIGLGLISYGLEGVGLSLFVPLLQVLNRTDPAGLPSLPLFGWALAPLADLDPVGRTVIL